MENVVLIAALQGVMLALFWWRAQQRWISAWVALAALQLCSVYLFNSPIRDWPLFWPLHFLNLDLFYGPILLAWLSQWYPRPIRWWPHALGIVLLHLLTWGEVALGYQYMPVTRWLCAAQILAYMAFACWCWWQQNKPLLWHGILLSSLTLMWLLAMGLSVLPNLDGFWILLSFMPVSLWIFAWGWLLVFFPNLLKASVHKYQHQNLPLSLCQQLQQQLQQAVQQQAYRHWQGRSDLAHSLNISEQHASQFFNEYLGISLPDFLSQLRVQDVALAIHHGSEENLLQLALNAGFGNKVSFNQSFKRDLGCTPSQFKKWPKEQQKQCLTKVNIVGMNALNTST